MDKKEPLDFVEKEFKLLKRAMLIGAYPSGKDTTPYIESLDELERLSETSGLEVSSKELCPYKKIIPATYLGTGKIESLAKLAETEKADLIIFDDEISPTQQKNLEALFKIEVIDRTELILEIFAQRAKTREATLQIELARVKYQLPRLKRLWTHLSRQSSGGLFVKGEGEKQIELDRRILKNQISVLEKELASVQKSRKTQRSSRLRSGVPTFAIVGYTNAGKSTLLKALTGADVFIEDKLFATLDTTTRKYTLPNNQEILLVDTVGFIRKIPHTLVAAFRSTLEESLFTDILLHIVDGSAHDALEQAKATEQVLGELGAKDKPTITVVNKIDAFYKDEAKLKLLKSQFPGAIFISAREGLGLEDLAKAMMQKISSLREILQLRIPQDQYALVSEIEREGKVLEREYEGNDIILKAEVPKTMQYKIAPFIKP